ncbi:MAG: restriction endonuclease subunit S, partial [Candidatus Mucispirillum faecigallinarum]|nr:restriction endonuclease subunit S [Candidatus Mucispirillum faecigallinarum]
MYKNIVLKDICEIWSGVKLGRLKKTNIISFSDITYKVLTFKAIDENGNIDNNEIEEISDINNDVSKYIIKHGDIVVGFSIPVKVFYARYLDSNIIATSHFAVIRLCDNMIIPEYLYNYLENYFRYSKKYISNTGIFAITIDIIKNI